SVQLPNSVEQPQTPSSPASSKSLINIRKTLMAKKSKQLSKINKRIIMLKNRKAVTKISDSPDTSLDASMTSQFLIPEENVVNLVSQHDASMRSDTSFVEPEDSPNAWAKKYEKLFNEFEGFKKNAVALSLKRKEYSRLSDKQKQRHVNDICNNLYRLCHTDITFIHDISLELMRNFVPSVETVNKIIFQEAKLSGKQYERIHKLLKRCIPRVTNPHYEQGSKLKGDLKTGAVGSQVDNVAEV
uniref:CDT1 domain-containing protein n=1 Tax=Parastrongyloides trichosuri TaxID=131310 RepID=A0A0N4ZZQ1_PARTI